MPLGREVDDALASSPVNGSTSVSMADPPSLTIASKARMKLTKWYTPYD
jgi:hypothetical protein